MSDPSAGPVLPPPAESGNGWPDHRLLVTVLLILLFAMIASRDITRNYAGLHGYAEAHAAWHARTHLDHGLAYTRGYGTFAVGHPPPANPERYLDHPPLPTLLDAAAMAVFGKNEWALRLSALFVYALCLPLLLRLLRALFDETTSVLAVVLFVLFPITGYFYSTCWYYWNLPLVLTSWWCYLALLGALRGVQARTIHQVLLCVSLFVLVQHNWVGLFYAAAIGTHYVGHCVWRRQFPDRRLFLVLLLSPLISLILDFVVLLAADDWDHHRLVGLYRFRSDVAGDHGRTAASWFATQWRYLGANFTFPVILLVVGAVLHSLAAVIASLRRRDRVQPDRWAVTRPFPHAWLFVVPGVLNIACFPEAFWVHQFQYIPFSIGTAIIAALAILRMRDVLARTSGRLAGVVVAAVMIVVVAACARGLNWYHASRHFPPEVLEMFKRVGREIPPDGFLLSYNAYFYQESKFKPAFYRPEIAWNLDRRIVAATTAAEVDAVASSGRAPYYLAEVPGAPTALVEELKERYEHEFFKGSDFHPWPPLIGMHPDRYLFDLRHAAAGSAVLAGAAEPLNAATFDVLVARGTDMIASGDHVLAEVLFRHALEIDRAGPKAAGAFNGLGWALQAQGRIDEALEAYGQALTIDPAYALARNNLLALEKRAATSGAADE